MLLDFGCFHPTPMLLELYVVFTIPTQHFEIKELEELTPDKFKEMVERQTHFQELQTELLGAAFGKRVESGLFDDLFKTE